MVKNKIAIMGAMSEEISPIIDKLDNLNIIEYGANKYYEGTYKGQEIVVAKSKIGKVFASLTASILIEKFKCNVLLFTGVAGAINPLLKIGDIIIANKLCQHDVDITAFGHPAGFISESSIFIEPDSKLLNTAKIYALENNINAIEGVIATGDQFIDSKEKKEWISNTFNADAIEMEGASVAVVCKSLNIPFLILRSISDTAEGNANENFDEFLKYSAEISAKFILGIVEEISS